jgi:hypothetical protein
MSGRFFDDDQVVELGELLCLAVELSQAAQGFVSAVLERLAGGSGDLGELRRDAARLVRLLSGAPTLAETTTGARR